MNIRRKRKKWKQGQHWVQRIQNYCFFWQNASRIEPNLTREPTGLVGIKLFDLQLSLMTGSFSYLLFHEWQQGHFFLFNRTEKISLSLHEGLKWIMQHPEKMSSNFYTTATFRLLTHFSINKNVFQLQSSKCVNSVIPIFIFFSTERRLKINKKQILRQIFEQGPWRRRNGTIKTVSIKFYFLQKARIESK